MLLPTVLHESLGTDVMGDRPSNDTSSNRQLENQRVNVASVKAFESERVVTIRKAERERERGSEKEVEWPRIYSLQGTFVLFNISGRSLSTEPIATFDFCIFYPQISQQHVSFVRRSMCIIYFAG